MASNEQICFQCKKINLIKCHLPIPSHFIPVILKGDKYFFDSHTLQTYHRTENGTPGEWAGVFNPLAIHYNDSFPDYS